MFTPLCSCHVDSAITFKKKKVLIPKLRIIILLYLPVSSTINTVLFSQKLLSQFIVFLLSGEHVVLSVFFSRLGELWHNTQTKIQSHIFAKQMSRSSVTLFKYPFKNFYQKAPEKKKIVNPPETSNIHQEVVLEICILQAKIYI